MTFPLDSASIDNVSSTAMRRDDIESAIAQRFERVVEICATQTAITDGTSSWTYDELNRRANRIAHAILHRTVPGNECVAHLSNSAIETVAVTLAVLKAGKVSLAIHPGLPTAARVALIHDAKPQLLVMAGTATEIEGYPVLPFDGACDYADDSNPALVANPADRAVIYYTSGSTELCRRAS